MLWGGHTPAGCARRINSSETMTDRNRSESGFPIFLLPSHRRRTLKSTDCRPPSFGKERKRRGGERGEGEARRRVVSRDGGRCSVRAEGKAEFWQLEFSRRKNKMGPSSLWNVPTQWKWKSVNNKDKCYHSSLSVCTSHMWFPGQIYHINLGKKLGKNCVNVILKMN